VDQGPGEPVFSASGTVADARVTVVVTGEVDMSTADRMYQVAVIDGAAAATLDLREVSFFDSAAIHALVRLAEKYGGGLEVWPSAQVKRVLDIAGLSGQPWLRKPED
jgi:anti-anti-sigma factor